MPRLRAEATERALQLVREGAKPYRAARECGVSPNTIYVAIKQDLVRASKREEAAGGTVLAQPLADPKVKSPGAGRMVVPSRGARRARRSPR